MWICRMRVLCLWLILVGMPISVVAQTTLAGEIEFGSRFFPEDGLSARQKQFFPVFQGTLRADRVSERGNHHWRLNVFGRADVRDRRQSHAELREATWAWRPNQTWDVRGGILADEWGFTESNTVIDIVNQRDQLEAPNGDAKLGQPGLSLASRLPAGRLTVYALPWHRTWRFAGSAGRFRPPVKLDEDERANATPAWAAHWDLKKRRFEIGLSQFKGVSREPAIDAAAVGFRAIYPVVHQTGAALQLVLGTGLLKADLVHVRSRERPSFTGFTVGGELPVTLGATDLTVLAEFTYDQRGRDAPTGLDRDLLMAARWSANNAAGTEATAGSMIDMRSGAQTLRASISRRLSAAWRWTAESHVLVHPHQGEFGYWLRRDSFIQVGIARFF
jgi:hypothetical protein